MILQKIKQTFSDASGKSPFFDKLYLRTKYRMAMFLGAVWSEEHYARWFYHLYTGKKLNLQNPRYFDEKLWWLKLNNRDPLLTKCSDKHAVRDYVKACGYEDILIPQVDVLDDPAQVDFKRQFTFDTYKQFIAAAGYDDVDYAYCPGRVPCAVAVIHKP